MAGERQLCSACHVLFFEQPEDERTRSHHTGIGLRDCAESIACSFCTVLWDRLSDQQRTDLSVVPCEVADTNGDDDGNGTGYRPSHLTCSYDRPQLRFLLPISPEVRQEHYGSTMPQIVDVVIEPIPLLSLSRLSLRGPHQRYAASTFSEGCALQAKVWIENCIRSHAHASSREADVPAIRSLPTRLIDVGTSTNPCIRLCLTRDFSRTTKFVTLSHRWGTGKVFQLEQANEAALMQNVLQSDLSKTFNDAVLAARMLDVQYIWIDSLCIMQDSKDDWMTEAARMANYYENAYCTLAASASGDNDAGLILARDPETIGDLHLDLTRNPEATPTQKSGLATQLLSRAIKILVPPAPPSGHLLPPGQYTCPDNRAWAREIDQSPLRSRGWIYQERLLSTRLLHFGRRRVFFECPEQQCSEDHPRGLRKDIFGNLDFLAQSPRAARQLAEWQPGPVAQYATAIWTNAVARYTQCEFTFPSDRLVALAGVAKRYAPLMVDSNKDADSPSWPAIQTGRPAQRIPPYFLGIWLASTDAVRSLCWETSGPLQSRPPPGRPNEVRYPSWSFGSVTSAVTFGPITTDGSEEFVDLARIVAVDAEFKDDDDGSVWTCQIEPGAGAMWLLGKIAPVQLSTAILAQAAAMKDADQARECLVEAGTWPGNPQLLVDGEVQRWGFRADHCRGVSRTSTPLTANGSAKLSDFWAGEYFVLGIYADRADNKVYGLVLNWLQQESNCCFERVGTFVLEESVFERAVKHGDDVDPRLYESKDDHGQLDIKLI